MSDAAGISTHHVSPGERLGRLCRGPTLVPRCERAGRREKELSAQRTSEGEKSQPATNLKTTRGSQGERTAEGRDD
jgi:hypothetical protein